MKNPLTTALERALGLIAGAALFGMMGLTFADVIGRKLFAASIPGSVELTELLMLAVIFAALPLTSLKGEHVLFDLLDPMLPAGLRKWQHRLANLACAALLGAAAWLVETRALRTGGQGDITAQLEISIAPFQHATAVMLLLTALVHLVLVAHAGAASDGFHVAAEERDD
jgi:TRAP-type C4-dicarboxylate transport system permease small subunit